MVPTVAEYQRLVPQPDRLSGGRAVLPPTATLRADLVSVITATFNSVRSLDRTIDSVLCQSHPHIEYIIIDGGSKDGTVDRLRAREGQIDLWLSERDRGIADAFNKGIALARGEYIAFINSDDWLEKDQIRAAVSVLEQSGADFVYGDLMLHEPDGSPAHVLRGEADYARRLRHTMPHLNHPTVVCRRQLYEKAGLFDTSLSIAMDYEWLLRVDRSGARGTYSSQLLGHMTLEGASDRTWRRALAEVRAVSIRYGYPPVPAWLRFWARVAKVGTRRRLEKWAPRATYHWARRVMNPNYEGRAANTAGNVRSALREK